MLVLGLLTLSLDIFYLSSMKFFTQIRFQRKTCILILDFRPAHFVSELPWKRANNYEKKMMVKIEACFPFFLAARSWLDIHFNIVT